MKAAYNIVKPALPYTWHLLWMAWLFAEVVVPRPDMPAAFNVLLSVFLVVVLGIAAVLVQLCCYTVCRAASIEWMNRV